MSNKARARLQTKVDLFMEDFILPHLEPTRILWVFSLSGGVDSWATREALRDWYRDKSLEIREQTLHVNQWDAPIAGLLQEGHWGGSIVADERRASQDLGFNREIQAQCGPCSQIRRRATDELAHMLIEASQDVDIVIARGHHLTDLSVSILWRLLAGRSPISDLESSGKGYPFVALENGSYLTKPLIYATKAEIELFAESEGIVGACACLSCPAHGIPSRRDIMNQTAVPALAMNTPSWELHLPGIREIFDKWPGGRTKLDSFRDLPHLGTPTDRVATPDPSIADSFYERALDQTMLARRANDFDLFVTLDAVAFSFLEGGPLIKPPKVPVPAFFLRYLRPSDEERYSAREKLMTLCYGPFWGLLALTDAARYRAIEMRAELFPGVVFDQTWAHSAEFFKVRKGYSR